MTHEKPSAFVLRLYRKAVDSAVEDAQADSVSLRRKAGRARRALLRYIARLEAAAARSTPGGDGQP